MELVVESLGFAPVLAGDAVLTAVDGLDIAVGVVEVGFTATSTHFHTSFLF